MKNFYFYSPTEILFGKRTEEETGRLAKKWGATKVLIVYGGGSVVRSGLLERVENNLEAEGIEFEELGGVKPNPRLSLAREGVKKAIDFGADFVLALGGGSAIDTAKGIALGIANPDTDIWEFWNGKEVKKSAPVGVILTISAAGSETSDSAVLTDETTLKKKGLSTDFNRPKFAIMNPELTYSLPKYQIACGVVDIMMHTLERYFSPVKGNHMTDEIAEGLLRNMIVYGPKGYANPVDYEAMSEIMWAGSLSHNNLTGLGRSRQFPVHNMGHEFSANYDAAHGASLSALWGTWALYVYKFDVSRFAHYAKAVWQIEETDPEKAALRGIDKTVEFFSSLDMPVTIGQLLESGPVDEKELETYADNVTNFDKQPLGTFLPLTRADVLAIYRSANI
ncbi:MAG: iron-containing alcohol dehydrogenase [Lachnospiraceae bacterium]|jgi:alcohol dehydrogenase YqhD (iron-dependent ADH family)|nr:iron-containing alcohol dehydrogenase [Lachnospiraceae bacterium]